MSESSSNRDCKLKRTTDRYACSKDGTRCDQVMREDACSKDGTRYAMMSVENLWNQTHRQLRRGKQPSWWAGKGQLVRELQH